MIVVYHLAELYGTMFFVPIASKKVKVFKKQWKEYPIINLLEEEAVYVGIEENGNKKIASSTIDVGT